MKTPEQRSRELVALLDEERRNGFCDEIEMIAHAFRESDDAWREELRAQVAVRDDEIANLKLVAGVGNRRDVTDDEKKAMAGLVVAGKSYREVARLFGLKSPSTVHKYVHEASARSVAEPT
jgi:DNA-directed RNA polymerase specialized sigma24 family protein